MKERKNMIQKGYFIAGVMMIGMLSVFFRIVQIQTSSESVKYKNLALKRNFREKIVPAARGNLYSSDGVLLSTTILKYDVFIDFKTINEKLFNTQINALSDSLSKVLKKPKYEIYTEFIKERKKENQYYKLLTDIDYILFERLKNFPIFKEGQNKGGFIVDRHTERVRPISGFGERTLGFDDERGKAGIEGAASEYIRGKNGKRYEQRINASLWKPVDNVLESNLEPIDGMDVVTTIDMRIQDISYNALKNRLVEYEAKHGCAIVMEVQTGKILAMVNLTRDKNGGYSDKRNYAVWESTEPGSTFKLMTMLAAMDDGYIDEKSVIHIGKGYWKFHGSMIKDEHYLEKPYTLEDILSQSSNVGVARIVHQYYGTVPEKFVQKLRDWRLEQKTGIEIPGESSPYLPTDKLAKQSKLTLPWMAQGYNVKITPLQTLNFYNALANDGIMLKPQIIESVQDKGQIIKKYTPIVLQKNISTPEIRNSMIKMLTAAVEKGTSKSIFTPNLPMAGKTGTAQIEYWKHGNKYLSSFCGFFPSNNPKYSCIIVISEPNSQKGYYGGKVAAPVFKEIAGKVFLKTPLNVQNDAHTPKFNIEKLVSNRIKPNINTQSAYIPNVTGYYITDVLPKLENMGLRVVYNGNGKIIKQSLPKGQKIIKGSTLYLDVQQWN